MARLLFPLHRKQAPLSEAPEEPFRGSKGPLGGCFRDPECRNEGSNSEAPKRGPKPLDPLAGFCPLRSAPRAAVDLRQKIAITEQSRQLVHSALHLALEHLPEAMLQEVPHLDDRRGLIPNPSQVEECSPLLSRRVSSCWLLLVLLLALLLILPASPIGARTH